MKFSPPYFLGGLVCADLCNTFDHRHRPPKYDLLKDYETVRNWGKAAGILPRNSPAPSRSMRRPIAELLKTRREIFRLLWPISRGEPPLASDVAAFNTRMQKVSAKLRIVSSKRRFALLNPADDPLERIIIEAVRSTADLLVSDRTDRIRQCGECGWLFYDASRNHLRRWCSMEICGNRAKARRHYEKVKRNKRKTARTGIVRRSGGHSGR
jgi:predicted RNA-binding Zn ribbon-like protein